MDATSPAASPPGEAHARSAEGLEALSRILATGFADASDRQRNLLAYLVREELAGRGDRLKAFSIAVDIFGRPADFDPQQDSIVRVEIGRLRKMLELFYATAGRDDPVRISIDKGQYRPSFEFADHKAPAEAHPRTHIRLIALAAAGAVVCALAAFLFGFRDHEHRPGPRIAVAPFALSADRDGQDHVGVGLQAELVALLSEFDWLSVFPLNRDVDLTAAKPADWRVDFVVKATVRVVGDALVVSPLLLDGRTGAVRWTGRYEKAFRESDVIAMQREIATRIAADVGQPYGAVADLERTRAEVDRFRGDDAFSCQLRALQFWTTYARADFRLARDCAERLGAGAGADPNMQAALALLMLDGARFGFDAGERADALKRSADLAGEAWRRNEVGSLPRMARYSAALCQGEMEEFRQIGAVVLRDYPNNPAILSDIGTKLALGAGDWQHGMELIARGRGLAENLPGWFDIPEALDALRHNVEPRAAEMHAAALQSAHPLLRLVDLAVQGRRKDARAIEQARAALAQIGYDNADKIAALLDGQCWSAETKTMLRPLVLAQAQ